MFGIAKHKPIHGLDKNMCLHTLFRKVRKHRYFSLNRPTGPIQSLSRDVRVCVCMSPVKKTSPSIGEVFFTPPVSPPGSPWGGEGRGP